MMMKLLGSNPWRGNAVSRVLESVFYSTVALASSSPFEPLYREILSDENRHRGFSIVPMLDQWVEEGKEMKRQELNDFIKQLRKSRRYRQALEVSEWMSDVMKHHLSPAGIAVRLGLISKVRGLEAAERYFDSIPDPLRVVPVYGSLLYCCADHKCLDKAEIVFEKMKELGFVDGVLNYNTMLTLYYRTGEHEKLHILVKEMEERNIGYDINTLLQLMVNAASCDVDQMEKLFVKMEADPLIAMDWHGYFVAANAFLKAGMFEKTSTLLRRSEQLIDNDTRKIGYEHLMTSYAAIGNKDEVYRIWDLYKNMVGFYNNGYRSMASSLMKLGDFDGVENIVMEWESGVKFFDVGIPNLLVGAYCRKGLFEKAKSYAIKLMDSGKGKAATWLVLATGYQMDGQMANAVEALKTAAKLPGQPVRKFNYLTLVACLEYLKKKGDVKVAHEILRLWSTRVHLPATLYNKLKSYIDGGESQVLPSLIW